MEIDQTSSEIYKDLMDQAVEALGWAKAKAEEFLQYANELEERANTYRKLAATLVIEARSQADEMADLLLAEFPMEEPVQEEEGPETVGI